MSEGIIRPAERHYTPRIPQMGRPLGSCRCEGTARALKPSPSNWMGGIFAHTRAARWLVAVRTVKLHVRTVKPHTARGNEQNIMARSVLCEHTRVSVTPIREWRSWKLVCAGVRAQARIPQCWSPHEKERERERERRNWKQCNGGSARSSDRRCMMTTADSCNHRYDWWT